MYHSHTLEHLRNLSKVTLCAEFIDTKINTEYQLTLHHHNSVYDKQGDVKYYINDDTISIDGLSIDRIPYILKAKGPWSYKSHDRLHARHIWEDCVKKGFGFNYRATLTSRAIKDLVIV